jgi:signal transduction histidine kinase
VNLAAIRFTQRILARHMLVALGSFLIVALFAPRLLGLEGDVAMGVLSVGAMLALFSFSFTLVMSLVTLRTHRRAIQGIARGARTVRPDDLGRLAGLPGRITSRFLTASSLISALILVPGVRPEKLDDGRAVSLLILTITFLGAATIPLYVLIRRATLDLFEIAPREPLTALLETLEFKRKPAQRITRRILFAVVAPVALMGAGAVLVAHAHLRTLTEQDGRNTAIYLARAALERGPGGARSEAGRADAIAAAAEFGYLARIEPTNAESSEPTTSRESDGQIAVVVPLDDGQAIVRFSADISPEHITGGVVVGLLGLLLAAFCGGLFGRALANDLVSATRSVRILGTESVLRGTTRIARPARFAVVGSLGRAIEALTERFHVFAAAQERALEIRAAAQRMRGLLFASVSHDLKSPLNAILGFAELVGQEDLTAAQHESLALIQKRGRELLGLIETILDAARVEAEQLTLLPRPTEVQPLVTEGIRKARELSGDADLPLTVEIADGLPTITVDLSYGPRALAVIVAHALRSAASDTSGRVVRVRATHPLPPRDDRVSIEVEYGSRNVTREELVQLFARQATGRGQGLTLGLSLARSVIELHGGSVEVGGAQDGLPVCRISLPLRLSGQRPKLSSFPALG